MANFRYLAKGNNANERSNYNNWWKEQIYIYGMQTAFYVSNVTLSAADPIYGEQPGAGYMLPHPLIILCEKNADTYLLSKFGIVADSDLTGVIHYEHFTEVFGLSSEPKMGDLIRLDEYGVDRLNYPRRTGGIFELTEVTDEYEPMINALAGHYVWYFKARRFEGMIDRNDPDPNNPDTLPDDNDSINEIATDFEELNPCSDDDIYGSYERPA